jgi:hypothetical protein
VPWLRQLVASLLALRPGINLSPVHVGFVMDKVALGQAFLQVIWLTLPVSFHQCSILLILHVSITVGM